MFSAIAQGETGPPTMADEQSISLRCLWIKDFSTVALGLILRKVERERKRERERDRETDREGEREIAFLAFK